MVLPSTIAEIAALTRRCLSSTMEKHDALNAENGQLKHEAAAN
jgi:hypothetical protein